MGITEAEFLKGDMSYHSVVIRRPFSKRIYMWIHEILAGEIGRLAPAVVFESSDHLILREYRLPGQSRQTSLSSCI